jgi:hypothetical protein
MRIIVFSFIAGGSDKEHATMVECIDAMTIISGLSLKGAEKQELGDSVAPPASNRKRDPSSLSRGFYSTASL